MTVTIQTPSRSTEIIGADALIAPFRVESPHTFRHMNDLGRAGYQLAQTLKLGEPIARQVEFAARFHDVGKLPYVAMVEKKGRLTESEETTVANHAALGSRLIWDLAHDNPDAIDMIGIGADVALHHHDSPEQIDVLKVNPDTAMVGHIADLVTKLDQMHAMTSHDRPYRSAARVYEAIEVVSRQTSDTDVFGFSARDVLAAIVQNNLFNNVKHSSN